MRELEKLSKRIYIVTLSLHLQETNYLERHLKNNGWDWINFKERYFNNKVFEIFEGSYVPLGTI